MKKLRAWRPTLTAILFALAVLMVMPVISLAQGRDHGYGRGRGRGADLSWKCGKFVNCHDARNGRLDGRGPNRSVGVWRNGIFVPRGESVRYRNRYSTNDYWQRRHLMYRRGNLDSNWRYRNRPGRPR